MQTAEKISYHLLILALAFSFSNLALSDAVHASIMNRLGNGRNLTVHCQSKDNDLGQQSLTDGNEFSWDFSVNVGGTTLFYCDIGWENVQQYHFDAYSFGRDYARFQTRCLWLISAEGMYALNGQTGFWEYNYHWPN